MVSRWVIFFGPEDVGGPRSKYYDENGAITGSRDDAAKFYTFESAKEFAENKNIELSETIYIGQQDFLEGDLIRQANLKQMLKNGQ